MFIIFNNQYQDKAIKFLILPIYPKMKQKSQESNPDLLICD